MVESAHDEIAQASTIMPLDVLNNATCFRRATRLQLMTLAAPVIVGYDSTLKQKLLPDAWTLVKESSMESREEQTAWRNSTRHATDHLSTCLRKSLCDYPHPMLSEKALKTIKAMKRQ